MHMLSELDLYDDSRHRAGTPYNYSTRVLALVACYDRQ